MNYRQIETSREIRQWIKIGLQAIGVGASCVIAYNTNPDIKRSVNRANEDVKFWVSQKLNNL